MEPSTTQNVYQDTQQRQADYLEIVFERGCEARNSKKKAKSIQKNRIETRKQRSV